MKIISFRGARPKLYYVDPPLNLILLNYAITDMTSWRKKRAEFGAAVFCNVKLFARGRIFSQSTDLLHKR